MGIIEDVLNYGRTYEQCGMTLEDGEVIALRSEIERLRGYLERLERWIEDELGCDIPDSVKEPKP